MKLTPILTVVSFAFGIVLLRFLAASPFTSLTWTRLVVDAFLCYILLSIILFSINLMQSLTAARKVKTKEEFEGIVAPAMRAENASHVPNTIKALSRTITFACVGIFLGAAAVLLFIK